MTTWQQSTSTGTSTLSRVVALGAFILGLAIASTFAEAGERSDQSNYVGPGSVLVANDGSEIHRTLNPVHALRSVEPFGTELELLLWDEELTLGQRTPHYAIVENGELRGRVRATSYAIDYAGERFDPLTDGVPTQLADLQARADNRQFLVQLIVTPLPVLQEAIRELGGTVHRHLSHHTMIVEMTAAARAEVEALPFVRWVGPFHPGYRLQPTVAARLAAPASQGAETERYSIMLFERGDATQASLSRTVRGLGGTVDIVTPRGRRIEATLDRTQLLALAHDNRVQYIDPWQGPGETDMEVVRDVGGADYVEIVAGFTGAGVRGEVFDTELRTTHQEWAAAPLIHSAGTNGFSAHGTSSTSNVFAQGSNSAARGVIPDAQPIFFLLDEATQFGGAKSRYDVYSELRDPAGPYRAVLQTSSVGNARTFFYTTISAETDDALFLHPVLSTQSQSNAGDQDSRPQAWAKNIVSIGGIRHQGTATRTDDRWTFGASIGPADDGRIKPDLAFFYDGIFSASRTNDTSYTQFGGTSSATPQTAGYFGLLFQMWHQGVWSGHGGAATVFDSRPNMMTAKALMIHHAFRYDWNAGGFNADLDRFKQGWGTADARNLYDTAAATFIVDEDVLLAPLGTYTTTAELKGTEPEFKATLAYLDPMGTVGAGVHRINDLSLRVTSPAGTIYWGNNGLTASNVSTSGGSSNTLDTVENVFVTSPEAGTWTVEVLADEVVADNHPETVAIDADFALIVSPVVNDIFADGFESGDTGGWMVTVP